MSMVETPGSGSLVPVRYSVTDLAIGQLADRYLPLSIRDVNDVAGYKAVHAARMDVKNKRVEVEKTRKALKEESLKWGRMVDAEAKRLTALLEPIESHLEAEEKRIDDAKEAIKNAARLKAEAEARAKREAEEAALRAEEERLRAEREKLEAEKRAVEEEKKRLAEAEAQRQRAAEVERLQAEAAERARKETEERLAREAAQREAARIRAEALRPDRDKLLAVAEAVDAIRVPEVSAGAFDVGQQIWRVLRDASAKIRGIAGTIAEERADA